MVEARRVARGSAHGCGKHETSEGCDAFFVTDHYQNYPMVLVRLDKIRRAELVDLLERAWRAVAPAALVRQRDGAGARDSK
jgi:hypothetical protein